MERLVRHLQEELEVLRTRLLEMGGLAEERVRHAVQGLAERDFGLIEAVLAGDEPVNQLHIEIDDRVLKLLALHQPVAADLRAVMAAVKINTDLERVGDLAVNIAEAAKRYAMHPPVKKLIDIPRMAEIAQAMLRDALDSYVKGDIALAQHVLNEDDKLDALKTQIFRELLTFMLQDMHTIEPSLDLILVSRHLERIGDHATNVAEDVIFMVSARDVRHHVPESRNLVNRNLQSQFPYLPPSLPPHTISGCRWHPNPCAWSATGRRSPPTGAPSAASAASCRIWRGGWTAAIESRVSRCRSTPTAATNPSPTAP